MKTQLELGLDRSRKQCRRVSPRRRTAGARWWFEQMHAVVEHAFDWTQSPEPRPEQIYLGLHARARHGNRS